MRPIVAASAVAVFLYVPSAQADDFEAGSLIIPMDTDYQDLGMFQAYGLVYDLLRQGVSVRWVIASGKDHDGVDFTASSTDYATMTPVEDHQYRGGPWVIDSADAPEAESIVEAWLLDHPDVAVHVASEPFSADVARYLVVAPTLAMVADGNEDIARKYMLAADIPDSVLDPAWPDDSPDMLDPLELAGPTETDHADGSLFDEDGDPVYCQLMSMHWGVNDAEDNPEVVAEVRQFLNNPTHFFAECQAVNAFENLDPHGFFLTPNGFEIGDQPQDVDFHQQDSPYAQIHGLWETVGGSEPAYSLPAGDSYKVGGITMITEAGTPEGVNDVWMTGFLDGACPPDEPECGAFGKVSYLGGHEYRTDVPVSGNLDAQGVRMFLNSLFEAPCATLDGLPAIAVATADVDCTTQAEHDVKLTYVNTSEATALAGVLRMPLPDGVTFGSASDGGTFADGDVTWDLGNLGPDESGDRIVSVTFEAPGTYEFQAELEYHVGQNLFTLDANLVSTEYVQGTCPESTGTTGGGGTGSAGSGGEGMTSGSADDTGSAPDTESGSGMASVTGGGTGSGSAGSGDDGGGCGCTAGSGRRSSLVMGLGFFLAGLLRRRRTAALLVGCSAGCTSTDVSEQISSDAGSGITATESGISSDTDDEMKLDVQMQSDVFSAGGACDKIDFLFVIDSSGSMADNQANLINSFPGLVAAMQEKVKANDWHVMVVDTDGQWSGTDCNNACQTLGYCPDAPTYDCATPAPTLCEITMGAGTTAPYGESASNTVCGLGDPPRYITADSTDLESDFSCVASVGVDGADTERPMDALMRATAADMNEQGGCNEGFLRSDAILVVTIITDEPDEGSDNDAMTVAEAVIQAKAGDPSAVVVLGLLPDGDQPNPLCGVEAVPAPRLSTLLDAFPQSSRASVCEEDYSPFFVDAVSVISQACEEFVPPG